MNNPRRTLLILLCSALLGIITTVTLNAVDRRTRAIERQIEAIEKQTRECPCAK